MFTLIKQWLKQEISVKTEISELNIWSIIKLQNKGQVRDGSGGGMETRSG